MTLLCAHCGREIKERTNLIGWEHADTGFVLCSHTQAEPAKETPESE